jgi:hypothetical protein
MGKFTKLSSDEKSGISFIEPMVGSKLKSFHTLNCSNTMFPAPLDIITSNAKEDSSFGEFSFFNYDTLYAYTMFLPEDGTDLCKRGFYSIGNK